jgi:hypothetical protein
MPADGIIPVIGRIVFREDPQEQTTAPAAVAA